MELAIMRLLFCLIGRLEGFLLSKMSSDAGMSSRSKTGRARARRCHSARNHATPHRLVVIRGGPASRGFGSGRCTRVVRRRFEPLRLPRNHGLLPDVPVAPARARLAGGWHPTSRAKPPAGSMWDA